MELASLASRLQSVRNIARRYELLEQLANAWERDKNVMIVEGN